MAGRTRVKMKWRMRVFPEGRNLPGVKQEIDKTSDRMASAAGPGYEAKPATGTGGRGRARGAVVTETRDAMIDNSRNHTLTRVLAQSKKQG